jgi:glycosyltransferase involved in cell wall biosynthesis
MAKVSAVIIAKNEEKKIGNCLASLKWADEVIVIDGFSTDKTVEIARAHGARVVQHAFTGKFADDRNLGLKEAKYDWVLAIDADDVIDSGFKAKLDETLSKNKGEVVYKFRRVNFFLGHRMDYGGFHHYIPNLVDRRHVKYEGVVHEVPVYQGEMGTLEADIEHHPFDSIEQFVARQNRYSTIAAGELLRQNGVMSQKEIRKGMIGKSFKVFTKSYFKKQGYKDGIYGLAFAVLFSFINFLKWAKYWELVRKDIKA